MIVATILLLIALAGSAAWVLRAVRGDQGRTPTPEPHDAHNWSNETPTHPYSERLIL